MLILSKFHKIWIVVLKTIPYSSDGNFLFYVIEWMYYGKFPFITQLYNLISVLLSFNQSISLYNKLIQLHMTIVDQYRGKTILITGTTGFLGKVLL